MENTQNIYQEIVALVAKACSHPKNSVERRRGLTQVIRLIQKTNNLWRESSVYYEDALQQTWIYFCLNLCEATTSKESYDPRQGQITTWLNGYLKRRLQDLRLQAKQQKENTLNRFEDNHDPIDDLAAPKEIPPILEDLRKWVESDPQGELRQTHIRGRKDITAQVLILKRLPPETSWKDLSQEWKVSVPTLSSFYQRKCRPYLLNFGQKSGYLS